MHVAQPDASTHSAGSVGHGIPTFPSHPSNSQNYFMTYSNNIKKNKRMELFIELIYDAAENLFNRNKKLRQEIQGNFRVRGVTLAQSLMPGEGG